MLSNRLEVRTVAEGPNEIHVLFVGNRFDFPNKERRKIPNSSVEK